ncbi:MAG: molybdopterin cofactor-binding domain-containing protein, partial [Candidatus Caldarchaeum sp.]
MMDILADKLGMDPVELRLKNAWRQGVVTASDAVLMDNPDFGVLAEKVCEELGWRRGEKHPDEGVGIAFMAHGNSLGPEGEDKSSATVRISSDGTVHVATSLTEYGTGASRGFVKIAASVLGVPEDRVVVDRVETQKVPDSGGTFASRSTLMGGNAVYLAAKRLRERIERLIEESGHKGLDVVGFVRDVLREEVSEYAEFKLPVCDYNPETGKGTPYLQYTYGVVGVRVKVDRELGVVRVKDIVAAFDVGRVVNEGYLTAQLEGGITQGVAYGLLEELLIGKKHKVLNPNLADYLVPTAADMPRVKVIVIENPSPLTPLGTRTAGEPGIDAPAAAIANAVYDALKIRITSLPITPEKVVAALEKSEAIAVFV